MDDGIEATMDEVEATMKVMLAKYEGIAMTADIKAEDRTGEVTTQIIQVNPQTCTGL